MRRIKLSSPAKINLTLEVIKRFPDGFHSLRSVMIKSENLFDDIELIFNEKEKGIRIFCDNEKIPVDRKNICWKISEKFFQKTGRDVGLKIRIKKRIPALAGLGGGSSNGASVLLGLNKFFGNILGFEEMVGMASEIGKDIPFFLQKEPSAHVSGAGEKIMPLKKTPDLNMLIINPGGEIATPHAYAKLDEKMLFMEDKRRKNISSEMVENFSDPREVGRLLYNDFDVVAEEIFPIIRTIKNDLVSFGALGASLTGKGPTIFAIFEDGGKRAMVENIFKKAYPGFFMAKG